MPFKANNGRRHRISKTRDSVANWPTYDAAMAIETGMILRLALGRPWRRTEGLLRSVARLMRLEVGIPDHTTLSRCGSAISLATELAEAKEPGHGVVDSTGLKVYGAGEWHREQHGGRKRHLAVDPDGGDILACELTAKDQGDPTQVGRLVDIRSIPTIAMSALRTLKRSRLASSWRVNDFLAFHALEWIAAVLGWAWPRLLLARTGQALPAIETG